MDSAPIVTATPRFQLDFPSFSIEFVVDAEASGDLTYRFNEHHSAFLFAAGEVWLTTPATRELVIPCFHPQNFLLCLKTIADFMRAPPSFAGLEAIIEKGGRSSWLAGYVERLDTKLANEADDAVFALLLSFSAMTGSRGGIAIYHHDGRAIMEVVTHSGGGPCGNVFWDEFDASSVVADIFDISSRMAQFVMQIMKAY